MARAQPTDDDWQENEAARRPHDWQELRSSLLTLLDQVEGQVARTGDRRRQMLESPRGMQDGAPDEDDVAEAIAQIKRRYRRSSARREAPAAAERAAALAAGPELGELSSAMQTISGRLGHLEDTLRQGPDAGEGLKDIAQQVEQLATVIQTLAGAVGENAEVKKLEKQLVQVARLVVETPQAGFGDMREKLDALNSSVRQLGEVQQKSADITLPAIEERSVAQTRNLRSIEVGVRHVYDRVNAIGKTLATHPDDTNRIATEMEGIKSEVTSVTRALKIGQPDAVPNALLSRIEAVTSRLAQIEGRNSGEGIRGIRTDIQGIGTNIEASVGRQFEKIDARIEDIGKKASGAVTPVQLEEQVRKMLDRIDRTSTQLAEMSELYRNDPSREIPNFDTLADMVSERTTRSLAHTYGRPARLADDDVDKLIARIASISSHAEKKDLEALEERISQLIADASHYSDAEPLAGLQHGIEAINDRLSRLEKGLNQVRQDAASAPAPVVSPPVAAAPAVSAAAPKPTPPAKAAAMPAAAKTMLPEEPEADADADRMAFNPIEDTPLIDKGFSAPEEIGSDEDPGDVFAELDETGEDNADEFGGPIFDPDTVERPAAPQSSFDREARELFSRQSGKGMAGDGATSSRNTFIEAARRAAQKTSGPEAGGPSKSLLARMLPSLFKPKTEEDEAEAEAPEEPKAKKPSRKDRKAAKEAEKAARQAEKAEAAVEDTSSDGATDQPAGISAADFQPKKPGLFTRYRRPILLAVTLAIVCYLTLDLISKRRGPSQTTATVPIEEQVEPAAAEPVPPVSEIEPSAVDIMTSTPEAALPADEIAAEPAMDAPAMDTASAAEEMAPELPLFDETAPEMTGSVDPSVRMIAPATSLTRQELPDLLDPNATIETPIEPGLQDDVTTGAISPAEPVTDTPSVMPMPDEKVGPLALREAASAGDARAQFEVAAIYSEGQALLQDFSAAAKWFERSADQGFAPAAFRLGGLYESGLGVDKDLEKARFWYEQAARSGNRMAMHNLAALYASGDLGTQEFEKASLWFQRAASLGLTDSQFNLGMLYARGLGVPQDLNQSFKWFSLAARHGDVDASKARDDIASSLDADTVASLQQEVDAWEQNPINLRANFAPIGTWAEAFDPGQPISDKSVIEKVQAALNRLGYDVGVPDGLMGPRTSDAIKSFERSTGMSESGSINPRLLAVLGSQPV